nr:hypothetical protein [Paracoccus sp. Z118]
MIADSTGLTGKVASTIRDSFTRATRAWITETSSAKAAVISASPMSSGSRWSAIPSASPVKASPTCEATTACPKGRVTTGSAPTIFPLRYSAATATSGPIIHGSGTPTCANSQPATTVSA